MEFEKVAHRCVLNLASSTTNDFSHAFCSSVSKRLRSAANVSPERCIEKGPGFVRYSLGFLNNSKSCDLFSHENLTLSMKEILWNC